MKNLRRFSVFLLFIMLFGITAYCLFPAQLGDLAENVRNGKGERSYVRALQGEDGSVYVLRKLPDGYRIRALSNGKCTLDRPLKNGLPKDYEPETVFVAGDGTILLGAYVRDGVELLGYSLYEGKAGEKFSLLLEQKLTGVTSQERRESAGIIQIQGNDGEVRFVLKTGGVYEQYSYDISKGQGLVSEGPVGSDQAETLLIQQREAKEQTCTLVNNSGLDADSISFLVGTRDGKALAITGESSLYMIEAGQVTDLTPGLYGVAWQSALILAGTVLLVLFIAYGLYYLVCVANKLYFPIGIKNFLTLTLFGFLVITMSLTLFIVPNYRKDGRNSVFSGMRAQVAQASSGDPQSLQASARAIAAASTEYADCTLMIIQNVNGQWVVTSSSDTELQGMEIGSYCRFAGMQGRVTAAEHNESDAFLTRYNGETYYEVFCAAPDGGFICLQVNATVFERNADLRISEIAFFMYVAALVLIMISLLLDLSVVTGIRRATKGIDLLAAGAPNVRVQHHSGDEAEALAAAFNDLSAFFEKGRANASLAGNAYLRFMPRQLVTLLGANSIEQVDKTTNASHEVAMMAVRFAFPKSVYQGEAQALFDNINEVFAHIAGAVSGSGGAIYNFTYDGFDAVFEGGARSAIGAAVEIRQALLELNGKRELRGDAKLELRVALDYGTAMMGVVGDEERVVPTVVSAGLTTARNLVELAKTLDANILCTNVIADAAKEYGIRYVGKSRESGSQIRVYEIYDGDPYSMRMAKESMREQFSSGIYAFYSGEFAAAKRMFMEIVRRQSEDGVARHYLYLADRFEQRAPEQIDMGT